MGKKKANGEGSISKRADGRYMARYTVNGKRKTIYGATHGEVREKLYEKLTEIAKGQYIEPTKVTVGNWLRTWLVTYSLPTVNLPDHKRVSMDKMSGYYISPADTNGQELSFSQKAG